MTEAVKIGLTCFMTKQDWHPGTGRQYKTCLQNSASNILLHLLAVTGRSPSLHHLVQDIFNRDQIQISEQALSLLISRLGNDRASSRQEIEKLALFAGKGGKLTEKNIDNVIGDNGAVVQDLITIAILNGNVQQFEKLFSRSQQDGQQPLSLLRQICYYSNSTN